MIPRKIARNCSWERLAFLCLLLCGLHVSSVKSLAVMSVDLGAEWMKVAVVSPGVPMEIALNPESKRKTASAVSLRNGERTFGSDALASGVKNPKTCYFYLLDLLGKPFNHPSVQLYRQRFPYYDMEEEPVRKTVLFRHDHNTTYSPEELLAMILTHGKQMAEDYTDQRPIRDVVLTVPVFFNQAERRAMLQSAELANLNVLQLINEPMAVALNYGMFRRKEINGTAKHLMFYDMGSHDTTVSIVSYQLMKTKERGFTETHPQAQVMGVAYDRTLGGVTLQIKLRDYLADKFNEVKKPKSDVKKNPRAMAKLFKEAGRVKNVLSANSAIYAQVENVMDDIDFKQQVTREDFLKMNEDYFKRVTGPMERAIAASGMTLPEISEVILVGAGTRVPRVQEKLTAYLSGRELGKNLNTDEAAAMGAVYKAADLSTGFKVKKFLTRDAVIFPVEVEFDRQYEDDQGKEARKQVKRNLFPPMNPFPQKKIMTFNKHITDFNFLVKLNELDHLPKEELEFIGNTELSVVEVKGVAEALDKHREDVNVETKGVKAHFGIDDSGLLHLTSVESVFEKTITAEDQERADMEKMVREKLEKDASDNLKAAAEGQDGDKKGDDDTWAKLGDTISSFFGDKKDGETGSDKAKDSVKSKKDKKAKDKKEDKKEEKKKEEKKKEYKPKVETIKEPLEFNSTLVDLPDMAAEQLNSSRAKLVALDEHDKAKADRATALNNLESYVIDIKDKLYREIFEKSSTEEEREKILTKCSELSDWIDEEATDDTDVDILKAKLSELTDLTAALHARVREHTDRPEALDAMNRMINSSQHFFNKANNSTGVVDGYFAQAELDGLDKKLKDIVEWRDKALKEQEEMPMHEMPKMTTSLIAEKAIDLDREVKFLFNKVKIGKAERDRAKRAKEAEEKKAKEKEAKKAKKAKKKAAASNGTESETNDNTTNVEEEEEDATTSSPPPPAAEESEANEEETYEVPEVNEEASEDQEESNNEEAMKNEAGEDKEAQDEETPNEKDEEEVEEVMEDIFDEQKEEQHTEL